MLTKFINYCKDSYNELVHKTTWPTMKQLTSQAFIVLYASILIAFVVFLMDQFSETVMKFIYSL